MSVVNRQFWPLKPFGPVVLKSTISDELHEILLRRANDIRKNKKTKKQNDQRKQLAGNLSEEYNYRGVFTLQEEKIVDEELIWLAHQFTFFSHKINNLPEYKFLKPEDIILQKPLWVNFMKSGEWNPAHTHTGDISCVIYLQVPEEIFKENSEAEHTKNSNTPSAGKIEFKYGENIGYSHTGNMIQPVVKDCYFFPANLTHMVYPFKSKVERISVSCNFNDKILATYNLNGVSRK
jgi:uncharacterized protein (TIGR02466 family)